MRHLTGLGRAASLRAVTLTATTFMALSIAVPGNAQAVCNLQAIPAQFVEDIGSSQRIDFTGKLRMLSQHVPAAACHANASVDPVAVTEVLSAASTKFICIINASEFGDAVSGIIGSEQHRHTLFGLTRLTELREPIGPLVDKVEDGTGTVDDVTMIAGQSGPLLQFAKQMVSEISRQYANPASVLQTDALVIDICGRQRMLAQRMSKNVCLIAWDINAETAMSELAATSEIFDVSFRALRDGRPDAGIRLPPNAEIAAGIEVVLLD